MRSKLAIFDLDGTLTATNSVDSACFVRALHDEFGAPVDSDWSLYRHCTDAGIAAECLAAHLGRRPSSRDLERVRDRFCALLRERLAAEPHQFTAVPGAARFVAHLRDTGWGVCIATGCWSASAELKRRAAGLPADIPIYSCDLDSSREVVVATALESSRGGIALDLIVCVGDGVWDVTAAARLGLGFLGVGTGLGAERLLQAGARAFVPDFKDLETALARLEEALPPLPSALRPIERPARSR
jgi:phosphoglycolate phosphatase-like HAD superfamily hydrolase